jgi:hypothetical protein
MSTSISSTSIIALNFPRPLRACARLRITVHPTPCPARHLRRRATPWPPPGQGAEAARGRIFTNKPDRSQTDFTDLPVTHLAISTDLYTSASEGKPA